MSAASNTERERFRRVGRDDSRHAHSFGPRMTNLVHTKDPLHGREVGKKLSEKRSQIGVLPKGSGVAEYCGDERDKEGGRV